MCPSHVRCQVVELPFPAPERCLAQRSSSVDAWCQAPDSGGVASGRFAGEPASVLQEATMGAVSLEPAFRRMCLEAIATATLNAGGCLAATARLP